MIATLEAKLNAKSRDKLKDSDFGLPKERKYPLNDEEHVRKAIQFFKYCEKTKRNELALNINKRLKSYNMTISVSGDNPFSKYADKRYVTITESMCDDEYYNRPITENMDFIKRYPIYSYNEFITLEGWCKVVIDEALEKCLIGDTGNTMIESINRYLASEYNEYASYICESANMYNMVESAKTEIIEGFSDIDSLIKKFDTLTSIIEATSNKYHAYRVCSEIISKVNPRVEDDMDSALIERFVDTIRNIKDSASKTFDNNPNTIKSTLTEYSSVFEMPTEWHGTIYGTELLDRIHSQSKNDLYIIDKAMGCGIDPRYADLPIQFARICNIDHNLTTDIDSDDSLFLSRVRCKYTYYMYEGQNNLGETVWFGHDESGENHYLIAKYDVSDVYDILLIELNPETINFITRSGPVSEAPNIKVIRVSGSTTHLQKNIDLNNFVSEAFAINEDGDIKITISPKNSYMDSYSSNHKMLVENWKNQNYEAMKKNLAYVFALILIIERSDEYKARDPKAIKARAFAINDFKTYLKHLQSVEPDFDFVEYYNASNYDKKIINIPRTTILGIKRILRTILLESCMPNAVLESSKDNVTQDDAVAKDRMKRAAATKKDVDSIVATMTTREREEMGIYKVKGKFEYLTIDEGKKVAFRYILRANGLPVAFFDLLDVGTHLNAVLGTRRGEAFRHKGYASKCTQQGINWYRRNKDIVNKPIIWWARKDNPGSQRVAEKFGFRVDNNHEYTDNWVKYVYK